MHKRIQASASERTPPNLTDRPCNRTNILPQGWFFSARTLHGPLEANPGFVNTSVKAVAQRPLIFLRRRHVRADGREAGLEQLLRF